MSLVLSLCIIPTGQPSWSVACGGWSLTKRVMLRLRHKLTSWKQSAWPCRALTGKSALLLLTHLLLLCMVLLLSLVLLLVFDAAAAADGFG